MAGGRPTKYTPELLEQAQNYISTDDEINFKSHGHIIPSMVGLALILNRAKSTLYSYADKNSEYYHKEFSDIVEAINDFQHFELTQGGLSGAHNATINKLLLHKHGHSDKVETDLTSGGKEVKNEWHIHPVTTQKNGED